MQNRRTADYYAVLELGSDATDIEIKRAWHEQMQVWHPDRFVHSPTLHRKAETRTQLINQAYQTLSDPTSRARYDAERHHPSAAPPPPRHSPAARPQPAVRPRQELRGPQTMLNVTRFSHPKIMVPAIHLLVDVHETQPYDFKGLIRIAGTRTQALPAGDYAIAEAPEIFRVERRRAEEFNTIFRIRRTTARNFSANSNRSVRSPTVFSSSKARFRSTAAADDWGSIIATA